MKKILALLLALAMIFSMAACGSKEEPAPTGGDATETDWPKDPVTVVVPYSAGGDTDTYCRQMCALLTKELGQNFVVVNTTGGSGVVASSSVLTAKNDGYTLLFHHTGVMLTQEAAESNEFSFFDDFDVVGTIARDDTYALIARSGDTRFSTLEEMIAWAKANPGQLRFSVTYYGATHAVAEAMQRTMGIEMNNIDVGSSTADRLTAFMADQCDVLVVNYMNIADYVENGDFVVLGICSDERLAGIEDFPTVKEQGYDVTQPKIYEVRAPKGTDPAIIEKLSAAMEKAAEDEEFKSVLKTYYAESFYRNAEDTISGDKEIVDELKEFFAE